MVELTDQEKLERRRQKRQQRILQAGESRLSKITGTAFRKPLLCCIMKKLILIEPLLFFFSWSCHAIAYAISFCFRQNQQCNNQHANGFVWYKTAPR
jgi:hypothetical protein